MKKTVFALLLVLLWTVSAAVAAELKVGDKASDFKLKDSTGKEYSLDHPQFKARFCMSHMWILTRRTRTTMWRTP